MISDTPEGGPPPDINEIVKGFQEHLSKLGASANAKAEEAILKLVTEIDGKLPPGEVLTANGAMVRISGWPRVSFFIWRRRHVLAWMMDVTQDGAAVLHIRRVPEDHWPSALKQYMDTQA